jgi:hypothetical protein
VRGVSGNQQNKKQTQTIINHKKITQDTLFNYYQTRRTFLMVHLIEIVTILSTFTIIQWMLLRFIQGRQRKEKQIDENSLCINIANNNNIHQNQETVTHMIVQDN